MADAPAPPYACFRAPARCTHHNCSCYVASDHAYLRFITQSGPSILGFVFNIVAYSFAWWKARRTAQRHEYDGADPLVVARHKAVVQRVLSSGSKYLIVYIVSWAPSVGQVRALPTSTNPGFTGWRGG